MACNNMIPVDKRSVLLLTLDSCRYDTFVGAKIPNLRRIGPLYRAKAPSYFTYGSHAAMFVGFTPGVAEIKGAFVNPKFGKIFRLESPGFSGHGTGGFILSGDSIMEGFRRKGYAVFGTGAVTWFDPATPTGRRLIEGFDEFYYPGKSWSSAQQMAWIEDKVDGNPNQPLFLFVNIGETHTPYYHEGADWPANDNPCVPFQANDRSAECRRRQTLCLEHVDRVIGPLLEAFSDATIIAAADHGDCWGEDGLWEHGVSHERTLTVPLLFRLGQIDSKNESQN